MKPEAQKILTMIEALSQNDMCASELIPRMDEIDARLDDWINNKSYRDVVGRMTFEKMRPDLGERYYACRRSDGAEILYVAENKFTRSIDAQEALRREGYFLNVEYYFLTGKYKAQIWHEEKNLVAKSRASNEPLARLHAWVQVWGMEP